MYELNFMLVTLNIVVSDRSEKGQRQQYLNEYTNCASAVVLNLLL